MRLTQKLLGYLNRVFRKDPQAFLAMRVRYAGQMTWTVRDAVLTLTVTGGAGANLVIDLSAHTMQSLAATIAGAAGYQVEFMAGGIANMSARILIDGTGDQDVSNGDHLLAYSSLLWSYMEALATELQDAEAAIVQSLLQLTTKTASDVWLEEVGSFYGVPRSPAETDAQYGPRIIAEALRPLSNNIAIEQAIADYTGELCEVVDVTLYLGVFPVYDGTISHDATYNYATVGLPNYGLFDVRVGYDLLNGGDVADFLDAVRAIVAKIRAAGTHLRALDLSGAGSNFDDAIPWVPTDGASMITAVALLTDDAGAAEDQAAGLAFGMDGDAFSEAVDAPTETSDGSIYTELTTEDGFPITAEDGSPILWPIGALFD